MKISGVSDEPCWMLQCRKSCEPSDVAYEDSPRCVTSARVSCDSFLDLERFLTTPMRLSIQSQGSGLSVKSLYKPECAKITILQHILRLSRRGCHQLRIALSVLAANSAFSRRKQASSFTFQRCERFWHCLDDIAVQYCHHSRHRPRTLRTNVGVSSFKS